MKKPVRHKGVGGSQRAPQSLHSIHFSNASGKTSKKEGFDGNWQPIFTLFTVNGNQPKNEWVFRPLFTLAASTIIERSVRNKKNLFRGRLALFMLLSFIFTCERVKYVELKLSIASKFLKFNNTMSRRDGGLPFRCNTMSWLIIFISLIWFNISTIHFLIELKYLLFFYNLIENKIK